MADATVMKLGVRDRLILPSLLPQQGGIVSQRLCKDIRKKVQLTQYEMEVVQMKDVPGREGQTSVTWNAALEEPKDIGFSEAELKLIADEVKKLDKAQKITAELLDTCEKFLDPQPDADTQEETA